DDVNEDTVADWLTANSAMNAYVEQWYDRSGNSRTATQSSDELQPQFVADTDSDGDWALVQTGTEYLETTWSGISGTAARAFSIWFKTSTESTSNALFGYGADAGNGSVFQVSIENGVVFLRCIACVISW